MNRYLVSRTLPTALWLCISLAVSAQEFIPAQPRGGDKEAKEFINQEIIYPKEALDKSIEGIVTFDFMINSEGLVKNLTVTKPVNNLLEQEATRLFKYLIWQPAIYRGKAVESKRNFSIDFSVRRYRKLCKERGYTSIPAPALQVDQSGSVYQFRYTDVQPSPVFERPGMDMTDFMKENFHYPENALRMDITGTVRLNFVVEPNGHVSNLMVIDHVGAGCSEEAIRLIKLLHFSPGMVYGQAVRVNMSIPITFGLSTDGSYKVSPAAGGTTFQ